MLSRRISFQKPRVYTVIAETPLFLSPDGDAADASNQVSGVMLREGEAVEVRVVQPAPSGELFGKVASWISFGSHHVSFESPCCDELSVVTSSVGQYHEASGGPNPSGMIAAVLTLVLGQQVLLQRADLRSSTDRAVRALQRFVTGNSTEEQGKVIVGWVPMKLAAEEMLVAREVTAVENASDPEHTVNVECLVQTWEGSLWCGMGNGLLLRLDLETEACSRPLQAHKATVSCMTTTQTHLWTGSFDRVVAVHSISPPARVAQLQGHRDCVTSLVTGKRKRSVYSTDLSGVVFKWHSEDFTVLASICLDTPIHCADYCEGPGGLWVGTGSGIIGLSDKLEIIGWISLQSQAWVLGTRHTPAPVARNASAQSVSSVAGDPAADTAWHGVQQAGEKVAMVAVMSALALGVETAAHEERSAQDAEPASRGSSHRLGKCRAVAVVSHNGDEADAVRLDVWAGGAGYLMFFKGGTSKGTNCWNMGGATMMQLAASSSEQVMCAAASDGWLLIFGLHSGRPMRKLKCHNDMLLSLAFVQTDRPGVLACGSAHNDGSITLCDGFHTLLGSRSSFLSDQIRAETMLDYDWLGFNTQWESGAVKQRAANAALLFDEEISDVATFSYHQRCWAAWDHSFEKFSCSPESQLLARFGVPIQLRRAVWAAAIANLTEGTRKFKEKGGNNYYTDITGYKAGKKSMNTRQIDLDLDRTFPTNYLFESLDGDAALALRRVLTAFSWHHPKIGYCQGLNRIAAMFLLITDEETTFWGLVGIVERVMTYEYYIDPLLAARVDMEVVQDLVSLVMPNLHRHFRAASFDIGPVCFQWLFSLYVTCLVPTVILRIWDAFLVQSCKSAEAGREVLFRYALGLLKVHESRILAITDDVELHQYLSKEILAQTTDCDQLTQAAYSFSPDFSILISFRVGEQAPLVRAREAAAAAKRAQSTPSPITTGAQ